MSVSSPIKYWIVIGVACVGWAMATPVEVSPSAQLRVQPIGELPGEVSLRLMLRKLASSGTLMQITAHPDDEDNTLLAMYGHGEGMETSLVSLTRGEGGQNEIGPELFRALSVLRTEEILATHRFDGVQRQVFTRAVDFGFSFSVEESLEKWGADEIGGDLVREIRSRRPDVIVGFVCGGEGGGQHHQASTILAQQAFRAAADPARYPEQIHDGLRPWQARRFFCTQGFASRQGGTAPATLTVDGSRFDALLGRTYAEIGGEARSMHKSQGMSQIIPMPGAASGRVYLFKEDAERDSAPRTLFEGIDTSLVGLVRFAGPTPPADLAAGLRELTTLVSAAQNAERPADAVAPLAAGARRIRDLREQLRRAPLDDASRQEIDWRLEAKEFQFQRALVLAAGVRVEALADDGLVVAGDPIKLTLDVAQHSGATIEFYGTADGVYGEGPPCKAAIATGRSASCTFNVRVAEAPLSSAYWTPRSDAARWDVERHPHTSLGAPFHAAPMHANVVLTIAGIQVAVRRPVQVRYGDLIAGEKRMDVTVVPPLNVRVSPEITILPVGERSNGAHREVRVSVTNHLKGPANATVTLAAPSGWRTDPADQRVTFSREDEERTVRFALLPPARVRGEFTIDAKAEGTAGDGSRISSSVGYQVIEYPHTHRRHLAEPARARVKAIDVTIAPGVNVGYVMGVGDQVPQAIEQLGASLHLLTSSDLAFGDLSQYDVIVTGVRAYERRADLRANNHRLIAYAESGGTVLVQYNKFEFNEAQYGPYPAKVSANRVTDENAPVEVLVPDHPVFNRPNRIDAGTWSGWVQERGLYFLGARDPRYIDLVRSADPFPFNAGPKTGALVEARVGKGRWIYVGLGLWRQLPAGTTGAYQLMANLLSLAR